MLSVFVASTAIQRRREYIAPRERVLYVDGAVPTVVSPLFGCRFAFARHTISPRSGVLERQASCAAETPRQVS